ncbi:MAG: Gfo/Idh/MocA family oxidoreductase [Anaerolineales bacterium]|jgi:UDP-N-acetyl-2-amino-2-deoxyglucuronate dehydrogenase
MIKNFAIIGVAGFVAPRHLQAIRDTGNRLVAAVDPKDSVGLLDQFSYDVRFFTEIERFDRYLEKLRRSSEEEKVHFVSICTPNYLHDAHCRLAMRVGADVICEKPLVVNPWNLDALQEIETETGCKINTILQLRVHPELLKLKARLDQENSDIRHEVVLSYITSRGNWYHVSWKGQMEKSGGIATNIGIHFFDLLVWLFGQVQDIKMYYADNKRMSGFIELERARVRWYLSVDHNDLPMIAQNANKNNFRSITVDGQEVEFSEGITDLHTRLYENTLAGHGFGIEDARPSIELTHRIRQAEISPLDSLVHPFLKAG